MRRQTRTERELARLRVKHKGDRTSARSPLPDLSVAQNHPSFGSGFAPIVWRPRPTFKTDLIVDHIHKSGLQVLSRSELPYAGGRKV